MERISFFTSSWTSRITNHLSKSNKVRLKYENACSFDFVHQVLTHWDPLPTSKCRRAHPAWHQYSRKGSCRSALLDLRMVLVTWTTGEGYGRWGTRAFGDSAEVHVATQTQSPLHPSTLCRGLSVKLLLSQAASPAQREMGGGTWRRHSLWYLVMQLSMVTDGLHSRWTGSADDRRMHRFQCSLKTI